MSMQDRKHEQNAPDMSAAGPELREASDTFRSIPCVSSDSNELSSVEDRHGNAEKRRHPIDSVLIIVVLFAASIGLFYGAFDAFKTQSAVVHRKLQQEVTVTGTAAVGYVVELLVIGLIMLVGGIYRLRAFLNGGTSQDS